MANEPYWLIYNIYTFLKLFLKTKLPYFSSFNLLFVGENELRRAEELIKRIRKSVRIY